jgi:hypothetical protein
MTRAIALCLLSAASLAAQTAETVTFRAVMSTAREVPAVAVDASGWADIHVHTMKNAEGRVLSGSVTFVIRYRFPGPVGIVGLHIHRGSEGENGPVRINSGILAGAPVMTRGNVGEIVRQAQILPNDESGLAAVTELLSNPAQYYVNLHTVDFAGGIIRGQLDLTEFNPLVVEMSSANEIPAITNPQATGTASVTIFRSFDVFGQVTSGLAIFEVNYDLGGPSTITGLHIHRGGAGVNGPVLVDSRLSATNTVETPASGRGSLTFFIDIPVSAASLEYLSDFMENPGGFYLNLHTTQFPGGLIRGQLKVPEARNYQVTMLPTNEVPPIMGLNAAAVAGVQVYAVKNSSDEITAATVVFDVNHRFPGSADFTGLHIHDGPAGVNGPVRVDSGITGANSVISESGFGNIFRRVRISDANGLATLNSLFRDPANHYLNLHSRVNPGGAVRAQMGQ